MDVVLKVAPRAMTPMRSPMKAVVGVNDFDIKIQVSPSQRPM